MRSILASRPAFSIPQQVYDVDEGMQGRAEGEARLQNKMALEK